MDENSVFMHLNRAFRRQRKTDYRPTGDDLAMGPFCVMFQIVLLFWRELRCESKTTYRKMKLAKNDLDQYTVGARFVWQFVVSSAVTEESARQFPSRGSSGGNEVIFFIDNSALSKWRPRNIENLSVFSNERERAYPAGAKISRDRKKYGRRRSGLCEPDVAAKLNAN